MNDKALDPAFEAFLTYLKKKRGFDFTAYKRATLMRRTQKRIEELEVEDYAAYQDYLEVHPVEFDHLFNTILINVTSFFRDPEAWEYLNEEVIPGLLANKPAGEPIRAWSVGCASGEEPYSLAMMLAEHLGEAAFKRRVKIYATDVDEEALSQARHASYSAEAIECVPNGLREKYFERTNTRYTFTPDLRKSVIFGRHNLLQDAPISHLDLLLCRNTLMYLNAEAQTHVIARFHFALRESGVLFMGKAEMLLSHADLFQPMAFQHRIFSKVPTGEPRDRFEILAEATETEEPAAGVDLSLHHRQLKRAFEANPVAQIILDEQGVLKAANAEARRIFELKAEDVERPFRDLQLSYRPLELRSRIEKAKHKGQGITIPEVKHTLPDGPDLILKVQITPLENEHRLGICISFQDVTETHELQEELQKTEHERETAHEELQSANEELETTNEELQSTIEELQTTNEELQSTNEEMETINEELQSSNAELQSLNTELRQRTQELNQSNAFLESILASVSVGVVVVDQDFTILLWNRRSTDLWGLRADEVIGRSLLALDIGLPVEEIREPLIKFQQDEGEKKTLTLEAINRRGQRVRVPITLTKCLDGTGRHQGVAVLMEEERQHP
jgi:two-component system CheB/CheR fusion protein